MGLIAALLGLGGAARGVGDAVGGVAEVFTGNRAQREAAEHQAYVASLGQFSSEFAPARQGRFDRFVDGLNRLPRPALALGTIGLFVFAMVDPLAFAARMQGLALVPDPLWWLLGAVVSFYFGARELHHFRVGRPLARAGEVVRNIRTIDELRGEAGKDEGEAILAGTSGNAAVDAWRAEDAS